MPPPEVTKSALDVVQSASGKLSLQRCAALVCFIQPKVVSDTEEMELARQLERLEEQNREISGDEASDSSGAEGDGGDNEGINHKSKTVAEKDAADDDIEIEDDDV